MALQFDGEFLPENSPVILQLEDMHLEIIELRQMAPSLGAAAELDAAFEAIAPGNGASAIAQLRQLDRRLASSPETLAALRGRGRMLVVCEALAEQISYFDTGALA